MLLASSSALNTEITNIERPPTILVFARIKVTDATGITEPPERFSSVTSQQRDFGVLFRPLV